jgi:RNA polymerase sigma-70 factor, ECF subfamily
LAKHESKIMSPSEVSAEEARAAFDRTLGELRPKLHRYCARMTGSVFDGEDVVQEALMKAINAFPKVGAVADLDGWLFRIAHNAALDFLRRRRRYEAIHSDEELEMIATLVNPVSDRQAACHAAAWNETAIPSQINGIDVAAK